MSNLEKYFGIRFMVNNELDPFNISILENKASLIANLMGFNVEDFFVYIHTISVLEKKNHFSKKISLKDKLKSLEVEFSANPTQIKKGLVKFYNGYVNLDIEKGINEENNSTSLKRIYKGKVLEGNNWKSTTLITYIKKDLNSKYRKIKINVNAIPTKKYNEVLKKDRGFYLTQLDLKLDDKIKLNLKNLKPEEIERIRKSIQKNEKMKKKQFNNNPKIKTKTAIINFGAGEVVNQKQVVSYNKTYEDLKKIGIDDGDINELKKLIEKKDKKHILKKVNNWIGKISGKLIDKGIDFQVPILMEKINELL